MVVFNALQTSLSGGIGRYSYELAKAIYLKGTINFKIVVRQEDIDRFDFAKDEDLIIVSGITNSKDRNYYEQFVLPKEVGRKYPDAILHYPDSMAPLFGKNKSVITIHDLAFLSRPRDFVAKTRYWKKLVTKLSVRKAEKIISITEFAKDQIKEYYSKYSYKAHTIHNGFNDFSKEDIDIDKVSEKVKAYAGKPYILTVSTISPRKNMDGLIKAFNNMKNQAGMNLVICGGKGWLYEGVFKLVEENALTDRVLFAGKTNDEELKFLYKNASLFVYPSFYEGFGLPPLEAMSYGIPCAVSKVSSMPEVLEQASLYFNPYSMDDMSEKMEILLKDEALRTSFIEKGFNQIKKFSWEKCAEQVIDLYEKLI